MDDVGQLYCIGMIIWCLSGLMIFYVVFFASLLRRKTLEVFIDVGIPGVFLSLGIFYICNHMA